LDLVQDHQPLQSLEHQLRVGQLHLILRILEIEIRRPVLPRDLTSQRGLPALPRTENGGDRTEPKPGVDRLE
jgi:hypothetical protein